MWEEVKRIIQTNQRFLLTTHINPDGDGVGSAVALMDLLFSFGKEATFVCDSPLPEKFHFLDFHQAFSSFSTFEQKGPFDVLIVLDTCREERIGRLFSWITDHPLVTLCIDHHAGTSTFADYAVIDSQACAVGAMIYSLFKECGYALTLPAAMGIYTSIISDTGRFSYGSTSRKAHKVADECIKIGVDPSHMYAQLYQQVPLEQIQIFTKALQRMEFYDEQRIVLQQVRLSDYAHLLETHDISAIQDFDYIHEFNKTIKGIECAMILWELPDGNVRVSLRSNSGLDIVKPMRELGGGGHPNAAGALIRATFEEAKEKMISIFMKILNN